MLPHYDVMLKQQLLLSFYIYIKVGVLLIKIMESYAGVTRQVPDQSAVHPGLFQCRVGK
jgi:hypothetical protein